MPRGCSNHYSQVFVEIRKKMLPAVVEKMPFVPNRYYHLK
jgi:hypothetical protein